MSSVRAQARRMGGCLCGAVRFEARGEPVGVTVCHCPSCRRAAGAQAVAWAMYPIDQVRTLAGEPRRHASSPGTLRAFCSDCGTSLSYENEQLAGMIDLTVGSFDDPESLPPQAHIWCRHRLAWVRGDDGLPAYEDWPPM